MCDVGFKPNVQRSEFETCGSLPFFVSFLTKDETHQNKMACSVYPIFVPSLIIQ